jgi:hypothetical protein
VDTRAGLDVRQMVINLLQPAGNLKIRSTTSLGGEVKPSVDLRNVKEPYGHE